MRQNFRAIYALRGRHASLQNGDRKSGLKRREVPGRNAEAKLHPAQGQTQAVSRANRKYGERKQFR